MSLFGNALLSAWLAVAQAPASSEPPAIVVPKIWDERALETWATPIAGLGVAPSFVSEHDYYAAPIDDLRTYPVYHPSREPKGYRESLVREGPKPIIEPAKLRTKADWIDAGKRVFDELDTPLSRSDDPALIAHFTDAKSVDAYRDASHDSMSKDGILLDYRWVVDREGKLKLSFASCQGCHSRLMPDGSVLSGAPSNFDLSDAPPIRVALKQLALSPNLTRGEEFYAQFGVPWREHDAHLPFKTMKDEEIAKFFAQESGEPPGTVFARVNGSPLFVTRMADLRGVRDRRYLDATATHVNRGPEDIARYGILVEFADAGVFGTHHMLPPDATTIRLRPSDEAMYALGLYLYSLDPAPSPYPNDELSKKGARVFESEGCAKCHTPPLYTNNKLIPVPGFETPRGDPRTAALAISNRRVHTDPGLALETRKGTGYYRVPSLRGVWYRGLYGHSGCVSSLEDWFDPRRLESDYVPTGWRGPGVEKRAVQGHEFGLDLDDDERRALIAFLRTL